MPLFCTLSHASVAPAPQEEIENVEARLNALHGALKEAQAQLDEAVAEGVITQDERSLLEELRTLTLDTITVDDFDTHELRAASFYDLPGKQRPQQAA